MDKNFQITKETFKDDDFIDDFEEENSFLQPHLTKTSNSKSSNSNLSNSIFNQRSNSSNVSSNPPNPKIISNTKLVSSNPPFSNQKSLSSNTNPVISHPPANQKSNSNQTSSLRTKTILPNPLEYETPFEENSIRNDEQEHTILDEQKLEEGEEEEELRSEEILEIKSKLKASITYTVGKISEDLSREERLENLSVSKQAIVALSQVVYDYIENFGSDLEAFAKHDKRSTISFDDIKLCARKNPKLMQRLDQVANQIGVESKEKKRKTASSKPPKDKQPSKKKKKKE